MQKSSAGDAGLILFETDSLARQNSEMELRQLGRLLTHTWITENACNENAASLCLAWSLPVSWQTPLSLVTLHTRYLILRITMTINMVCITVALLGVA